MMETVSSQGAEPAARLNRDGWRRTAIVVGGIATIGVLMFAVAGRLDWLGAWLYLGEWVVALALILLTIARRDPDLINERGRTKTNQKAWDKRLMGVYSLLPYLTAVLAALDAGRYRWAPVPRGVQLAATALFLPALAPAWWAMRVNRYLSSVSRIQDDRGQEVVTVGPYRYVRHPTYVGAIVMWALSPLVLGSWWAALPSALAVALFVWRTALEDRMLHQELAGYAAYAEQVRWRLLPGVW